MKKLLVAILLLTAGFAVNAQNEKHVCTGDEMKSEKKLFIK